MVLINVANLVTCAYFYRQSLSNSDGQSDYMRRMRVMGLIFTLVALYRAVFVSRYLYQYAWFDTLANSSVLIRSFAWGAELSFSGLFALAMLRFNKDMLLTHGKYNRLTSSYIRLAPYALIACIFIAQFFATAGLITKSRLSFAIEESLWSLGFLSILPLAAIQFWHMFFSNKVASSSGLSMLKTFTAVNLAWCIIYCTYGLVYHLPTEYWASAFQQIETGIPEIKTGLGAVKDAISTVNVTHTYSDWGFGFVLWHSAYFSVCVWLAIFLMRAPRKL
ncbi:MAG: hypothetical protein V7746_02105 [Halioglobus sp.]